MQTPYPHSQTPSPWMQTPLVMWPLMHAGKPTTPHEHDRQVKKHYLPATSFAGGNYNQNPAPIFSFGKLETVTPMAYIYIQYLYFCWNSTSFQQWPCYIIDVSKKLLVFYQLLAREISLIKFIVNILLWDRRVPWLVSWWYWYVL